MVEYDLLYFSSVAFRGGTETEEARKRVMGYMGAVIDMFQSEPDFVWSDDLNKIRKGYELLKDGGESPKARKLICDFIDDVCLDVIKEQPGRCALFCVQDPELYDNDEDEDDEYEE